MISYPFISDLFTAILSKSKAIEGRFYICPRGGSEINSDVLGQVIKDNTANLAKKYPLCLMMPPISSGEFRYNSGEFITYRITLFFLKTSYYGEGSNISSYTNTSQHSIPEDWHDMNRAAVAFMSVLDILQTSTMYVKFRINSKSEKRIQPVSEIGIDNASGVRLDFALSLFTGCEPIEDYNESDVSLITVPSGDSHPEHHM